MAQTILVEKTGSLARVTLNRPEARNALYPAMIEELRAAFAGDLSQDRGLSAVVLCGRGKSFCAGADLGWMKAMAGFSLAENIADADALFAMLLAVRSCPVPVIARVHGHAYGGALGLIAACDVALADSGAEFCFSEVKMGLAPAVISPFVLEKAPLARASRLMLAGEAFTAEAAFAAGLLATSGCAGAAELDAEVSRCVEAIGQAGPEAVRATKALLRAASDLPERPGLRAEVARAIAERRASAEGQEGLQAFFEKRAPAWRPAKNAQASGPCGAAGTGKGSGGGGGRAGRGPGSDGGVL
jgi:methylglutaconyl-CoA hydratase